MVETLYPRRSVWQDVVRPGVYGAAIDPVGLTVRLLDHTYAATILGAADKPFPWPFPLGQRQRCGDLLVLPVSPTQLFVEGAVAPSPDVWMRLFGQDAVIIDQTGSRASLQLSGPAVQEVLARGVMIDCDPLAFPAGSGRVTQLGALSVQISVDGSGVFELSCMRSMAGDLWHWVENTASRFGIRVVG